MTTCARRLVSAVVVFVFFGVVSALGAIRAEAHAPAVRAEVEPNDSPATASRLPLVGGYGVGTGAIGAPGDVDVWSFIAPANAKVWLLVDTGNPFPDTSADTVVDLIAPDGTTVLESDDDDGTGTGGDATNESSLASAIAGRTLVAGGRYYIRVQAFSESAVINPYRLLVVVTRAGVPEVEPNDGSQAADAIRTSIGVRFASIGVPGDIDFYSIAATAGDDILLSVDADPARVGGIDLVVDLLASDGTTVITTADRSIVVRGVAQSINYVAEVSGNYFVRIRHATAAGTGAYALMAAVSPRAIAPADFDGDGLTDLAIYRGSTSEWFLSRSLDNTVLHFDWGSPSLGDIPVPADYDGDGIADPAIYRSATGEWFIYRSSGGLKRVRWGSASGDVPVPGDYDGDGIADIAVYRRSTAQWFILYSAGGTATIGWGSNYLLDVPVPADYDGDGRTDLAVFRTITGDWFVRFSGGGMAVIAGGTSFVGAQPASADYDGDGAADIAGYQSQSGAWLIRKSSGGVVTVNITDPEANDIAIPGDYDGDGKIDVAIYRPRTGLWIIRNSSTGTEIRRTWGSLAFGDIPLSQPAWTR